MCKETKDMTCLLSTKEKMVVNSWLREPHPTDYICRNWSSHRLLRLSRRLRFSKPTFSILLLYLTNNNQINQNHERLDVYIRMFRWYLLYW